MFFAMINAFVRCHVRYYSSFPYFIILTLTVLHGDRIRREIGQVVLIPNGAILKKPRITA
jgi:hypothetical protein